MSNSICKQEKKKAMSLIRTHKLIEKLIIDKIMIKILPSQNKHSSGRMLISAVTLTVKVINQ